MIYSISRFLSFLISIILFPIKVNGRENIPKSGGFILASNHVSYLDPIAIAVVCPRKLNFMARHDLFNLPIFSWLMYKLHAFPVKRKTADASALKESIKRVRHGKGLLLFPEGTRISDGLTVQPQAGIGFLAAKLNVPVIPTFIKGTERALPKGAKFIKPTRVSIFFGKQISLERRVPYQDIARNIMEEIRRLSC